MAVPLCLLHDIISERRCTSVSAGNHARRMRMATCSQTTAGRNLIMGTQDGVPFLWRLAGEGFALFLRAAPGYEARMTPYAALILSGEPIADLNYAILDEGPE